MSDRMEKMMVLAESNVADTIAKQLGGVGRIKMMLGGSVMATQNGGLGIKWPSKQRAKAGNYVEITLDVGSDTYNMEFFNVSAKGNKSLKKYTMIYADQMKSIFRDQTGLALSL